MNAKKFSEAMGELDNRYIEEAVSYSKVKPHFTKKRIVVLAAAAILVVLICCAASGVFGTWIIDFFKVSKEPGGSYEAGYDLGAAVKKIPVRELKGEISELSEIIRQQYKDYDPVSSWSPGHVEKAFSSGEEAIAYIGYDALKLADPGMKEQEVTVSAYGDEDGRISSVTLEVNYSDYALDQPRAQSFTQIYTENYEEEIMTGARTTEDLEFTESWYTTVNGSQCQIIEATPLESGFIMKDGYIVEDGILYNLHIAYKEKDTEKAQEMMRKWADQF